MAHWEMPLSEGKWANVVFGSIEPSVDTQIRPLIDG
jgi:hypothetical protein